MGFFILIAVIAILDQLAKFLIVSNMELYQSIPVIPELFHITYINNDGAAFSLLQGRQGFLILITSVLLLVVMGYLARVRKTEQRSLLLSLSLLCGGGIGNLIDRVRFRYVIDFLDFRVFPVFNIADVFVVIGCGLILLHLFYFEPRMKKKDLSHG